MSGLKNTFRRIWNVGTPGGVKGYQTKRESDAKKAAKRQAVKDKMFASAQIPDAEEIKRNERRRQAKRAGSRAQTVLTDQDTLG